MVVFGRRELLICIVGAAFFLSGSQAQLAKEDEEKLNSLSDAWENTNLKKFFRVEKKDVVKITDLTEGVEKEDVDTLDFVYAYHGVDDTDVWGTVDQKRSDVDRAFEVFVMHHKAQLKWKRGGPKSAPNDWFEAENSRLEDVVNERGLSYKLEELNDLLSAENVESIVEATDVDGAPEGSTCYEVTPTDEYKISQGSAEDANVTYTATYCMDSEENVLVKAIFIFTESFTDVDDEGNESELNVERNTDVTISDFDVEVEFPDVDFDHLLDHGHGKSHDHDNDSGTPGLHGANPVFFAMIFVLLSMGFWV